MIIAKDLLREEMREDGYCQVVVRVSHNDKLNIVNTAVFAKEEDWDDEICRICDNVSDCKMKNEQIDSIYRRIAGHVQSFIDSLIHDNFEEILTPYYIDDKKREQKKRFSDLVQLKVDSCVSLNTKRGYESFGRYMMRHKDLNPELKDISREFTNKFVETVDKDYGDCSSMRRFMFSRFNAVISLARECGHISMASRISLPPYSLLPSARNLTDEEISNIFDAFSDRMREDPQIEDYTTYALGLFILDIAFQGLAPVDLANLKVKSLNFKTMHNIEKNNRRYNDEFYRNEYDSNHKSLDVVTVSTSRKKTGRPVEIVASVAGIEPFIRKLINGKSPEDYLIDCYETGREYNLSQRQNRLANYFNKIARYFNSGIKEYYRKHELGKSKRITFYFARHAFCNLVDSFDIPRHIIQMMVGHRSSVLETSYLRPITQWEQAEISHKLLTNFFPIPAEQ